MKKIAILLFVGICITLCAGCGAKDMPSVMFVPKNVDYVEEPVTTACLDKIVVTTGDDVGSHLNSENFRLALIQVLSRANIFGEDEQQLLELKVHVYQANIPLGGFTMEGDLGAQYTLTDSEGKVLFNEDIFYETSAGVSDAFLGSARALMVFQNTNQGHMNLLLSKLKAQLKQCP